MTDQPAPEPARPAAGRLLEIARLRDQELDYLDAEYARALAAGEWNPEELHARYLQTREVAAARHSSALTAADLDYIAAVGPGAHSIAVQSVKAPYPAPGKKARSSSSSQAKLHDWQTPVAPQAGSAAAAVKPNSGVLRKLSWVGAGLLAVVALAAVSSISSANTKTTTISPVSEPISTTRTVTYEVVGGAKTASITYETATGTSQATIAVPLKNKAGELVTFEMERGAFVYLSAQNRGTSGNIICRISVDGVVISTNTSSGSYAIASCDGMVR